MTIGRRTGWGLVIAGVIVLAAISWAIPRRDEILHPERTLGPTAGWVSYQDKYVNEQYIVLRRPLEWKPYVFRSFYHYGYPIVKLSTVELRDPCTKTKNAISCRSNVKLGPGDVYMDWEESWFPRTGDPLEPLRGEFTTINGNRAKVSVNDKGCSGIESDREISVTLDVKDHIFVVFTCIRGPNVRALTRDAINVIRSARFAGLEPR